MSELICNFGYSEHTSHIPNWALDYLLTKPLRDILHSAAFRTEHDSIPYNAEFCALRKLNIGRILRRRWIEDESQDGDSHHRMKLGLYLGEHRSVIPFILIIAVDCLVESQWPPRLDTSDWETIRSICTMFVIDYETGKRLHLRSHLSDVRLPSVFTASSGERRRFKA